jgi:hypothetical protein
MMKRYVMLLVLVIVLVSCSSGGKSNLTVDQAMQAFRDAGLECENPQPVPKTDDSPLPKTFVDAKRCVVPSVDADHGLRVFAFENDRDLKMVKDYYEGFSGVFGSYVYVRDNLLFQTSVSMPKELAEQYRETFESFQP